MAKILHLHSRATNSETLLTLFTLLLIFSTKEDTSASLAMKMPSKYGSSDLNASRKNAYSVADTICSVGFRRCETT